MSACTSIVELAADQSLRVEDGVDGVVWDHGDLVIRGVVDEALGVREGDIGGCCVVASAADVLEKEDVTKVGARLREYKFPQPDTVFRVL